MSDDARSSDSADVAIAAALADAATQRRMVIPDPDTAIGRAEMLRRMREAKRIHYWLAFASGCHRYIETNGIQGVILDQCERLEREGLPWVNADIHGRPADLADFELTYLEEKLGCILLRKVRVILL